MGLELETTGPTPIADALLKTADIGARIGLRGQIDHIRQTQVERRRDGAFEVRFDVTLLAGSVARAQASASSLALGMKGKTARGVHGSAFFVVAAEDLPAATRTGKLCPLNGPDSPCTTGQYKEEESQAHSISLTRGQRWWPRLERKTPERGLRLGSRELVVLRTAEGDVKSTKVALETRPTIPVLSYCASQSAFTVKERRGGIEGLTYTLDIDRAKLGRDLDGQAKKMTHRFEKVSSLALKSHGHAFELETSDAEVRIRGGLEAARAALENHPKTRRRYELGLSLAGLVNPTHVWGKMVRLKFPLNRGDDGKFRLSEPSMALVDVRNTTVNVDLGSFVKVGGDFSNEHRHALPLSQPLRDS